MVSNRTEIWSRQINSKTLSLKLRKAHGYIRAILDDDVSGLHSSLQATYWVVDQLLQAGYRVKEALRSLQLCGWVNPYFANKYGPEAVELFEVPGRVSASAFVSAIRGAAGAIHVAVPVMQFLKPHEAVPTVFGGTINFLMAAATQPSAKREWFSPLPRLLHCPRSQIWSSSLDSPLRIMKPSKQRGSPRQVQRLDGWGEFLRTNFVEARSSC